MRQKNEVHQPSTAVTACGSLVIDAYFLIAEDHPVMRESFCMMLRDTFPNHKTIGVENGDDVLPLIEHQTPDVLIMDLIMPNWSGLDLLWILAKQKLSFPILCISGYQRTDYQIKEFDCLKQLLRLEYLSKMELSKRSFLLSVENLMNF